MLEGLEISEILKSELERTARIDSEFYAKDNLKALEILEKRNSKSLTEFLNVSDGNHMSISEYFTEKQIPYYRGGDIYNFFIEQTNNPLTIPENVYHWPHMKRSHLKKGDVLISIVGAIIGNLSLVKTNQRATCSCKLAILRPKNIEPELAAIFLKSKYGQNQIQKFRRGSGQTGLILEDFDQLLFPVFSNDFREEIKKLVDISFTKLEQSQNLYIAAETLLLETIGLNNFQPSTDPVNVKSFKESFGVTGRLDSEHYQKKYEQIEMAIKENGTYCISDVFEIICNPSPSEYTDTGIKVVKTKNVRIPTIDIENITDYTNEKRVLIEKNDLIFASMGVGSLGRFSYIEKEIENCTTDGTLRIFRAKPEFKNKNIEIPCLLFLTSSFGQELIYKYVIGSTGIISISKDNVENLIFPKVSNAIAKQVTDLVLETQYLKAESERLLGVAKKAVEIAIEQNEEMALQFLKV